MIQRHTPRTERKVFLDAITHVEDHEYRAGLEHGLLLSAKVLAWLSTIPAYSPEKLTEFVARAALEDMDEHPTFDSLRKEIGFYCKLQGVQLTETA